MTVAPGAAETATDALRWVTDAAVPADGGAAWPVTRAPGAPLADDLYEGTAGVLVALAEAHLSGIQDFDEHAQAAAGRLGRLVALAGGRTSEESATEPGEPDARTAASGIVPGEPDDAAGAPDYGLYTGLSGSAAALRIWASVSGDRQAGQMARAAARRIAEVAESGQAVSNFRDLVAGEAGVLLLLTEIGDARDRPAEQVLADRLINDAQRHDGEPDWYARDDIPYLLPNTSHGAAGIGYALAAASATLDRPDLLAIAVAAGRRLVRLGTRPDGTLSVPHSIPLVDPDRPVSFGWCHGPTGTLRLFGLLDQLQPDQGWAGHADACRRAVRASGLPARLYPGFWDNVGQCCGTAGVGEMALDSYQETGDTGWLAWAGALARDVLDRRICDQAGTRWSQTEHRASPPELEPYVGWMQGAAGIAGWLLRLARVERDGTAAQRVRWPDRPSLRPTLRG